MSTAIAQHTKHLTITIDKDMSLLLVGVPKEAYDFKITGNHLRYFMPNSVEIPQFDCTGSPEMVIADFTPLPLEKPWQWEFNWHKMPLLYDTALNFWGTILKILLGVKLKQAFTLTENPFGKNEPSDDWPRGDDAILEHDTVLEMKANLRNWREAEPKVMPERFVVIKMKPNDK